MSDLPQNDDPQTPEQVAADLGGMIGREAGGSLLKMSRAALLANASREGSKTSEYKLSIVLALCGAVMVSLGAYLSDATLQEQGTSLLKWVGAGYAASRGLAKLGAGAGAKRDASPQ